MKRLDRILTVVVTATLTSAFWILFGSAFTSEWLDEGKAPAGELGGGTAQATPDGAPLDAPGAFENPAPLAPGAGDGGTLAIPVRGISAAQLSDTYADSRGGGTRLHEALDIMAPHGTPVVAAAPGTVERLFKSDAGGNTIYVRSNDRLTIYYYAHLQAYAAGLAEGDVVRRGEMLGTVGSSGNASSDGPHLHFAIMRTTADADWWEPASAVNPYPMLAAAVRPDS